MGAMETLQESVPQEVLKIEDLSVNFRDVEAVKHVSFDIMKGETVALVGNRARVNPLAHFLYFNCYPIPSQATRTVPSKSMDSKPWVPATRSFRNIRGSKVTMIFQEPMTSLNPLHRIEKQMAKSF